MNSSNRDFFVFSVLLIGLAVSFWYSFFRFRTKGEYLTFPEKIALEMFKNNPEKVKELRKAHKYAAEESNRGRLLFIYSIITTLFAHTCNIWLVNYIVI